MSSSRSITMATCGSVIGALLAVAWDAAVLASSSCTMEDRDLELLDVVQPPRPCARRGCS